jgi:hypothetical protein
MNAAARSAPDHLSRLAPNYDRLVAEDRPPLGPTARSTDVAASAESVRQALVCGIKHVLHDVVADTVPVERTAIRSCASMSRSYISTPQGSKLSPSPAASTAVKRPAGL